MTKNKLAEFKYENSFNLDIVNPGKLDGPEAEVTLAIALSRKTATDRLIINGVSLSLLAQHYNNFANDSDIEKFFDREILYDFKGNTDDKIEAVEYLKQIFHQRGLLYPISSALRSVVESNQTMQIRSSALQQKINIVTTNKGFKIHEIASL